MAQRLPSVAGLLGVVHRSKLAELIMQDDPVKNLPERIQKRLAQLRGEIEQIVSYASQGLKTQLPGPISFRYRHSAAGDVLTDFERAQSLSFVTRYEQLPNECRVQIVERDGQHQIGNMGFLRHALNDWRPVIQLKKDPVYYQNVHAVWYPTLLRKDPAQGLCVTALAENDSDVTSAFAAWMGERNKAITAVLRPLDYDYLYNGVLQHSVAQYSKRFMQDYTSGEWNYILWKHVQVLRFVHEMLKPHHVLASMLTFPKLGPL